MATGAAGTFTMVGLSQAATPNAPSMTRVTKAWFMTVLRESLAISPWTVCASNVNALWPARLVAQPLQKTMHRPPTPGGGCGNVRFRTDGRHARMEG